MPFGITPFSLGAALLVLIVMGLDLWSLARRNRDPGARQTVAYRGHIAFELASGVVFAVGALFIFGKEGLGSLGRDLLVLWIGLAVLRLLWRWWQDLRGERVP